MAYSPKGAFTRCQPRRHRVQPGQSPIILDDSATRTDTDHMDHRCHATCFITPRGYGIRLWTFCHGDSPCPTASPRSEYGNPSCFHPTGRNKLFRPIPNLRIQVGSRHHPRGNFGNDSRSSVAFLCEQPDSFQHPWSHSNRFSGSCQSQDSRYKKFREASILMLRRSLGGHSGRSV